MTSSGWGQLQSDSLPQFPLPGGKLPARWASVWVGQRAAPQVYQAEPPQQGWKPHYRN